tara:strand:- start:822 stop:1145 length:324 start_codon:yes stop_codon:yes gene_type:complete
MNTYINIGVFIIGIILHLTYLRYVWTYIGKSLSVRKDVWNNFAESCEKEGVKGHDKRVACYEYFHKSQENNIRFYYKLFTSTIFSAFVYWVAFLGLVFFTTGISLVD